MEKVTSGSSVSVATARRCSASVRSGCARDCYGIVGSCCMEFDGDDLYLETRTWWESRIETKG